MQIIQLVSKASPSDQLLYIFEATRFKKSSELDKLENQTVLEAIQEKRDFIVFNKGDKMKWVVLTFGEQNWKLSEKLRKTGAKVCAQINENKKTSLCIHSENAANTLALAEGLALANYQFLKYFTKDKKKANSLQNIRLLKAEVKASDIHYLNTVIESTYLARTLVNEPHSFLNSVQLSEEIKAAGKAAGFTVEVWNESKIEAQKMGGILAVNKGSKIPPTFNILEHKPKKAINKKPYVLIGKGVVYDTGGLSLKPTPMSMDFMKSDMAGSAVVTAVLYAVAKLDLPLHVVGLVPATDNWIGENSYAPGDVITMYSGTTVEIMNTDAEGRLILADALHYAKKLKPELVCDFATLTGAAVRAIGTYATALMGNAEESIKQRVFESSYAVFERLVEFPLWEEYGDELKSEIADMTNLGKSEGGQISAAKFLEHFTDYPWLHFDIAGPAFHHATDAYKTKGGSGVGVRLMIDFLAKLSQKK